MQKPRSTLQNKKFSAIVGEVAHQFPLVPYRNLFAREAWKRHFLKSFVRDARLSAFYEGRPDPFPVRPVPSSDLDSESMSDLIEFCAAWCAQHGVELSK